MAVAGTVAAPVAVQAGADELYASARVGIWSQDTGGASNIAVRSFSSRFGARGETDLGNGITGFGRYEWDVDFNADADGGAGPRSDDPDTAVDESELADNAGEDDISVRHRYVGLKGDFGSVLVGQTYHTFYNFSVAPVDIPWWHSGYAMVNYRSRTDNAVTYAGGTGAVAFGVSAYFDDDSEEEEPDQLEAGVSFGIGDMTLGVALQNTASDTSQGSAGNDEDILGLALSGISFGDVSMAFVVQTQDDDLGIVAHFDIGNLYVHVEQLSVDAASAASESGDDEDKLALTLGYTQSLGRKTTMYYEVFNGDADTGDSDDDLTTIMAVLKYDII